jgi:hypothetical protein
MWQSPQSDSRDISCVLRQGKISLKGFLQPRPRQRGVWHVCRGNSVHIAHWHWQLRDENLKSGLFAENDHEEELNENIQIRGPRTAGTGVSQTYQHQSSCTIWRNLIRTDIGNERTGSNTSVATDVGFLRLGTV